MDFDFDDQPSDHAAPAVRAGARFIPKRRPQPKKKQVSLSISQTTLSTDVAKEKLSTLSEDPVSLDGSSTNPSKAIVPDSGTISQSTIGTLSEENVDVVSGRVNWSMEPSVACNSLDLEGKRCNDGIEMAAVFPDDSRTQDSTIFGDFVTPETDTDIHAQTGGMQTGLLQEDECRLDMETLDIVQDEGTTSAYESRNGFSSHGDLEEEEELNIPRVPGETIPQIETGNAPGGWEHEELVVSPCTNNTVTGEEEECLGNTVEEERSGRKRKIGKQNGAAAGKQKNRSEEPNKSSEKPEKKFKHSCRRKKNT